MMRRSLLFAVLSASILCGHAAVAQEEGVTKRRLDSALSVLRAHQDAAGKACLDAMTRVHQTEDQVADVSRQAEGSNHQSSNADIASDVLESDYENAQSACQPDADRVCQAHPTDVACSKMHGPGAGGPPGP